MGKRRIAAGQRGFTLLEVIVAVALLAVIAVLSLRGIDSVLRSRERLTAAAAELDALTVCFTQLEEDLRRAWPVRLRLPGESPIQFSAAAPDDGVAPLSLLREGGGSAAPGNAAPAAPLKAEVIHWWTSGGESAAVKALADAYSAAGGACACGFESAGC